MQIKTNRKSGFTLVEIMIVVAIIGLLAAIAIPNFVKARTSAQKNACINNLRQMEGAQEQLALEDKLKDTDPIVAANAEAYLKAGKIPECPASGTVAWGATVIDKPTCDVAGHVLP